jgi:hypothetical protein
MSEKRVSKEEKPNHAAKRHAINQDGSLALKLQYKVIVVIRHFLSLHLFLQQLLGHPKGHMKKNVVPTPICVTNSIFPPINLTCGQGNLSNQRPTRTMWIWLHKSFLFFPYHYNSYEVYPLH